MSTPQVIHHTDYRSKAEDRKRELEKLQEKGLAKTQAAQLRDAPVPTEACNFLKKQRELFKERRKNQADAIEFLHQFRADDDFVLRSARRSLGSKTDTYSVTPKSRYTLEPGQQPDAKASVYSYAVYPTLTQTLQSGTAKQDNISKESLSPHPPSNPPDILTDKISFQCAFDALELAAREASRHPLPEDSDLENGHDNNEFNSILIVEGEIDDFNVPSEKHNCDDAADSSATPFIPFEAFSKLGESLVLESQNIAPSKHCHVGIPLAKSDSDDESIIPGLSFMQLGASMMANDLSSSSKDDEKESVSPIKEPKQSTMESSDLMSNTATDVTASQVTIFSKSLTVDAGITEQANDENQKPLLQVYRDGEQKGEICQRIIDTEALLGDDAFENIATPKKSNRNLVVGGDSKDTNLVDQFSDQEENLEENDIHRSPAGCDNKDRNCDDSISANNISNDHISDQEEKLEENNIHRDPTGCDNKDTNIVDQIIDQEEKTGKNSTHLNVVGCDKTDTNCVDRINDQEEKLEENENQLETNSEVAVPESIVDESQTPRRNGTRKKKKKKDKSYFPSSSLFVSRQFLSR